MLIQTIYPVTVPIPQLHAFQFSRPRVHVHNRWRSHGGGKDGLYEDGIPMSSIWLRYSERRLDHEIAKRMHRELFIQLTQVHYKSGDAFKTLEMPMKNAYRGANHYIMISTKAIEDRSIFLD